MATPRPSQTTQSEPDDLEFRHRTLVSANRILESKLRSAGGSKNRDDLYVRRLRRMKTYLGNAISAVEREMEDEGMEPAGAAKSAAATRSRRRKGNASHLRVVEAEGSAGSEKKE